MKLIETVEAIQTSRRAASSGAAKMGRETAGPKTDGVADIGARRRRRRRDDEEPPLPM